ncbi:MAG: hypothetical protein NTZ19_13275 [Bacteroidetes bacterium]|nr:hypothetical protein [Bacteroidota bacterium]
MRQIFRFGYMYLLIFHLGYSVGAQISISGKVIQNGKGISGASINIFKTKYKTIIAYTISDKDGNFSINSPNAILKDSLLIKINALGYSSISEAITLNNQVFNFNLHDSSFKLPDIKVTGKIYLRKNNDTLNYTVDAFKNKQDRGIIDVLKRLPGIEVTDNGKIYYNGKPISDFYIDGDNLLDDRYNIATNAISADMVEKVQVLENHQPIKVLKDAGISNKVAINLSLKDKAHFNINGHFESGIGYSDKLMYSESADILLFKNRFKAINTFKTNNVGIDNNDENIPHNKQENNNEAGQIENKNLLNIGSSENTNLRKQQYLFNNSIAFNANNLFKTKNDIKFKNNIYLYSDKQFQDYTNTSLYYLPNDTVRYIKQQHTEFDPKIFRVQLNINDNKQNHYFNATAIAEREDQLSTSLVFLNNDRFNQNLSGKKNHLTSEMNYITIVRKKNIIEGYSFFSYSKNSENLALKPGINEDIFNNNQPYSQLTQNVVLPDFFCNNFITYRKSTQNSQYALKFGLVAQMQKLSSDLYPIQINGNSNYLADSFRNSLISSYKKIFTELKYSWQKYRFTFSAVLPLSYQYSDFHDTIMKIHGSNNNVFFTPSIFLKYQTHNENYYTINYSTTTKLGKIEDIFTANILKNYMLLENNLTPFRETNTQNISFGYNFRRPIKLLFINLMGVYTKNNDNSISSTFLYHNIQKQTNIYFNNETESFTGMFYISKYSFLLHSTISLKANVKTNKFILLQNGQFMQYGGLSESLTSSISSKLNEKINVNYEAIFTNYVSRSVYSNHEQSLQMLRHKLEIKSSVLNNIYINVNAEEIYTNQSQGSIKSNYVFCNAYLLFKANKIKTDFSLSIDNITDIKQYRNITLTGNNYSQSDYTIRPRMLLIKATLNL